MFDLQERVPTATTIHHHESDPLKRLAAAVLLQAVKDSGILKYRHRTKRKKELRREAIHFLTHDDDGFQFWCQALNLHPDRVRLELKKRLTRG